MLAANATCYGHKQTAATTGSSQAPTCSDLLRACHSRRSRPRHKALLPIPRRLQQQQRGQLPPPHWPVLRQRVLHVAVALQQRAAVDHAVHQRLCCCAARCCCARAGWPGPRLLLLLLLLHLLPLPLRVLQRRLQLLLLQHVLLPQPPV